MSPICVFYPISHFLQMGESSFVRIDKSTEISRKIALCALKIASFIPVVLHKFCSLDLSIITKTASGY